MRHGLALCWEHRTDNGNDIGVLFQPTSITFRLVADDGRDTIRYSTRNSDSVFLARNVTANDPQLDSALTSLYATINGSVDSRLRALDDWIAAESQSS